jgi:ubiquinone/menaquinone biosynthesis C-methylase UbiE
MIAKLLAGESKQARILDVGCCAGSLLKNLGSSGFSNIYGLDINPQAVAVCKKKNLRNVFVMDGSDMSFHDEEFDVVIASDVLEHIKNENVALSEWNRVLRPGGKLIIFVPAFTFLWSAHDEANGHMRRYSARTLKDSLQVAGFSIRKMSYWNASSFFPALVTRTSQRFLPGPKRDQLFETNPIVNSLALGVLKCENAALMHVSLPFGVSLFAVAEKDD